MKMTDLVLLILTLSPVYCDSHSLRHYYSAVTDKGSSLPEFSITAYVDEQQINVYSSDSGQFLPVAPWIHKEGPEYWDIQLQIAKATEPIFRNSVRKAMIRFNQTGGFHSYQWKSGCELGDDGSVAWYSQVAYDGRDFSYLDTQRGIYVPVMYEAEITTQRWNSPEIRLGEKRKYFLEIDCIKWLKKFIEYGKEDLEKRVRPEVKVWGRQSDKVTRLQCLVYGFHPRAVDVKWVRNGVDDVPSDEMSPILPHPDGTYQIRVSAEVPAREGDTYSCHVDHSSLEDVLTVDWEPKVGLPTGLIVCGIVGCLIFVALIVIVCVKQRTCGYKSASTSDPILTPTTQKPECPGCSIM